MATRVNEQPSWTALAKTYIRSGSWKVRRFCQEDWILCVWAYRILARRRIEVAIFLAEDHEKFVKDAGVMGGLVFVLSEAYNQLGKMEVDFVGPPEGHESGVPNSIRRVAKSIGVQIAGQSRIADAEGRQLYARLTGLSAGVEEQLRLRNLDLIRTCFVVQRRIWCATEVEYLVRHAHSPDRLLSGGVAAENRLSYQHDLLVLRTALTSERLRTLLMRDAAHEGDIDVQAKWVAGATQEIRVNRPVSLITADGQTRTLAENAPLKVSVCARSATEYQYLGVCQPPEGSSLIIVTQDYFQIPKSVRAKFPLRIPLKRIAIPLGCE